MAEISNPQVVEFCNVTVRPQANRLAAATMLVDGIVEQYNARDLGTIINAAGSSELITDGSQIDGRTRATGGDVFNFITLLNDFNTFMTQGRRDVLSKWKTVTTNLNS